MKGRKNMYDTWVEEGILEDKLLLIEGWARDGLTDENIYNNLGISRDLFYRLKKDKKEIKEALKKGKEVVDLQVENKLYKRAMGYSYTEITKELVKDPLTGLSELVITKEVTKEVQPDITAQIFWLKNRKPAEWRDKQTVEQININEIKVELEDE